jgi:hypothetical protein
LKTKCRFVEEYRSKNECDSQMEGKMSSGRADKFAGNVKNDK